MMALVTLTTAGAALVRSGRVGAVTAYHNAPALGVIAGVCTDLLKKGATFVWGKEQQKAYQYVLNCITSKECLAPFHWGKRAFLRCDASAKGYAAVLGQYYGRQFRPVCFISKKFQEPAAPTRPVSRAPDATPQAEARARAPVCPKY